jgi:3-oxoacyl-[acyl-carrier protein] reductase
MTFAGRRVLITGGSRGIGLAAALAFSFAHDEAAAEEALATLGAAGARAHAVRADVADAAAVARLAEETPAALGGPIEILVNNAAVTHDALLMMLPEPAWDRVVDTNLRGVYLCCRAFQRGMIAARAGRIVNVVSPAAFLGKAGAGAYAAAKGGVVALTKTLAREVARFGITVNAVSPGLVDTRLVAGMGEAARADLVRQIPLGRLGSPEEIAAAILFLASPAASYVTGTTLHVDGGLTML